MVISCRTKPVVRNLANRKRFGASILVVCVCVCRWFSTYITRLFCSNLICYFRMFCEKKKKYPCLPIMYSGVIVERGKDKIPPPPRYANNKNLEPSKAVVSNLFRRRCFFFFFLDKIRPRCSPVKTPKKFELQTLTRKIIT